MENLIQLQSPTDCSKWLYSHGHESFTLKIPRSDMNQRLALKQDCKQYIDLPLAFGFPPTPNHILIKRQ